MEYGTNTNMDIRLPRNKLSGQRLGSYREEEDTLTEATINGGMVTSIDAADIENNQFVMGKNVSVRYDKTSRRYGTEALTPAKPNTNTVLHIANYELFGGDTYLMRFTPSTIHKRDAAAWVNIVGALTGSVNDRFTVATINNRMFFTNNGVDPIQEINITANTFAQAGNAPRYKYICAFNNRIVGASFVDAIAGSTIKVGWSGNLAFTQWDSSVDPSAGSVALVDTATPYSDNISGLFGFTEIALMLRERSLWGIAKQPVSSDPFNFFPIHPGIGCDSPFTAVQITNGIAWFDIRTGTVYAYKVGDKEPSPIGRPVEKSIVQQLNESGVLYGSYNSLYDEYSLCLPDEVGTTVKVWTYNFKTKAWVFEEHVNLTCLNNIDYASQVDMINDLVGNINDLVGVIDSFGSTTEIASRFYGYSNGDITVENQASDLDNGIAYTMLIQSKIYRMPRKKGFVQNFALEYIPRLEGSFTIAYSKDGGTTWTNYKTVTMETADIGVRKRVTCKKHINASNYQWQITCLDGLVDFIEYDISIIRSPSEQEQRS